ncbi:MAG TPA: protein kinase [Candidatus Limnocylindria bacterium]
MTDEARPPSRDAPLEPDPMLGRVLADRYRIDALVARGGMARVYRARDERLERDVAIKVLAPPYGDDAAFTERFLGEARAAASLSHPSLVHVYDSGSDGPAHYIVMELLDRHRTLREILSERGSLSVREVVRIGRELLAGLRVVHERGLVHCDVKGANVMLGAGPAKLIDFGIARPPHDGLKEETSIGTLQAMSPEQLHGEALTPASDLFSLGTVLYEAITGRVPYPGSTPEEVSAAQVAGNVAPPSSLVPGLPDRLDAVLLQSLRRDPASRFHSAAAMARALEVAAESDRDAADDETRVIRTAGAAPASPVRGAAPGGYVPPPVPDRPAPSRTPAPARNRGGSRRRAWNALGTLLILGVAGLVIVLLVLPLLGVGTGGIDAPSAEASASAPSQPVAPGIVPDTVGLPTDEAIELASEAGLDWTVRCNENREQPEGIIDQEPPAGTEVAPGSQFTMFSARIEDCR